MPTLRRTAVVLSFFIALFLLQATTRAQVRDYWIGRSPSGERVGLGQAAFTVAQRPTVFLLRPSEVLRLRVLDGDPAALRARRHGVAYPGVSQDVALTWLTDETAVLRQISGETDKWSLHARSPVRVRFETLRSTRDRAAWGSLRAQWLRALLNAKPFPSAPTALRQRANFERRAREQLVKMLSRTSPAAKKPLEQWALAQNMWTFDKHRPLGQPLDVLERGQARLQHGQRPRGQSQHGQRPHGHARATGITVEGPAILELSARQVSNDESSDEAFAFASDAILQLSVADQKAFEVALPDKVAHVRTQGSATRELRRNAHGRVLSQAWTRRFLVGPGQHKLGIALTSASAELASAELASAELASAELASAELAWTVAAFRSSDSLPAGPTPATLPAAWRCALVSPQRLDPSLLSCSHDERTRAWQRISDEIGERAPPELAWFVAARAGVWTTQPLPDGAYHEFEQVVSNAPDATMREHNLSELRRFASAQPWSPWHALRRRTVFSMSRWRALEPTRAESVSLEVYRERRSDPVRSGEARAWLLQPGSETHWTVPTAQRSVWPTLDLRASVDHGYTLYRDGAPIASPQSAGRHVVAIGPGQYMLRVGEQPVLVKSALISQEAREEYGERSFWSLSSKPSFDVGTEARFGRAHLQVSLRGPSSDRRPCHVTIETDLGVDLRLHVTLQQAREPVFSWPVVAGLSALAQLSVPLPEGTRSVRLRSECKDLWARTHLRVHGKNAGQSSEGEAPSMGLTRLDTTTDPSDFALLRQVTRQLREDAAQPELHRLRAELLLGLSKRRLARQHVEWLSTHGYHDHVALLERALRGEAEFGTHVLIKEPSRQRPLWLLSPIRFDVDAPFAALNGGEAFLGQIMRDATLPEASKDAVANWVFDKASYAGLRAMRARLRERFRWVRLREVEHSAGFERFYATDTRFELGAALTGSPYAAGRSASLRPGQSLTKRVRPLGSARVRFKLWCGSESVVQVPRGPCGVIIDDASGRMHHVQIGVNQEGSIELPLQPRDEDWFRIRFSDETAGLRLGIATQASGADDGWSDRPATSTAMGHVASSSANWASTLLGPTQVRLRMRPIDAVGSVEVRALHLPTGEVFREQVELEFEQANVKLVSDDGRTLRPAREHQLSLPLTAEGAYRVEVLSPNGRVWVQGARRDSTGKSSSEPERETLAASEAQPFLLGRQPAVAPRAPGAWAPTAGTAEVALEVGVDAFDDRDLEQNEPRAEWSSRGLIRLYDRHLFVSGGPRARLFFSDVEPSVGATAKVHLRRLPLGLQVDVASSALLSSSDDRAARFEIGGRLGRTFFLGNGWSILSDLQSRYVYLRSDPRTVDGVDPLIDSPYLWDHPFTMDVQAQLRWFPSDRLFIRLGAEGRANSDMQTLDNMTGLAEVHGLLFEQRGDNVQLRLRYRPSLRLADAHRSTSYVRHQVASGVIWNFWQDAMSRWRLYADYTLFAGGQSTRHTLQAGVIWQWSRARGMRDVPPPDERFEAFSEIPQVHTGRWRLDDL